MPKAKRKPGKIKKNRLKINASLDEKIRYLEDEELKYLKIEAEYERTHLWEYFKPFRWQAKCDELVAKHLIVLAPAPNKIGKCLEYNTLIETLKGDISIGSLYKAGKSFDVYAWDGNKKVIAKAHPPFKKEGLHECYKITMSDGRIIEAADHHRILTDRGWKHVCCLASLKSLQLSRKGTSPSVHALDGRHLNQIPQDYLDGSPKDCYFCGEQLLLEKDISQVSPPLPSDELIHICSLSHKDDSDNKYINILSQFCDRLSSLYVRLLNAGRSVESLFRPFLRYLQPFSVVSPTFRPLSNVEVLEPLPSHGFGVQGQHISDSFENVQANQYLTSLYQANLSLQSPKKVINPVYPDDNYIVSIIPTGVKECYDFTVEKYHNYLAGGLIHHNTAWMICMIMSWLVGYEAWNEVSADYPDGVEHKGRYYKPSSLGIKPPVRIRLTGEDWNVHLGQTVVPEMKKWLPLDEFDVKNTNGIPSFWTHRRTGSTIELLTHNMEDAQYESWIGHGWVPDEPPGETKFSAMSRGLFGQGGKIVIPTTPLKEAWMLDRLVLSNRTDIAVMHDLCCLDNEIYYDNDDKILTEMGLTGRRTKYWREMEMQKKTFFDFIMRRDLYINAGNDGAVSSRPDDMGISAEKFLRENTPEDKHDMIQGLRYLKFAKDTALDEKPSRFFGMFKKLVGLIFKEFSKSIHIVHDDGKGTPCDWIVTFEIDFHLGKPHAIAFYACSERNIHYCIDEVWENMTAEEIAHLIIRKKKINGWNIKYGEIDPLSKGDDKYMKNRNADIKDAFTVIEDLLDKEDIELEVASKDMKSGYMNIKSWLRGTALIPTIYFLDSLQSFKNDGYGHIYEIQRLCYVKSEPENKDNHFMECLYRYTNAGIEYTKEKPYRQEVVSARSWMA